jgi:hypothetical protein
MGLGSGIGYKENSLIISGMEIPIGFGFEEKNLPPKQGMGTGMRKNFPDRDGSWEPFPAAIPSPTAVWVNLL